MLLQVKNAGFAYNSETTVLNNISFSLDRGVFAGILGPNGAGKSTLLKCINKIYDLKYGEILLDDQEIGSMSRREIAQRIAYVPQHVETQFPVSVLNTVLMGRLPYSGRRFTKSDREAAIDAMEETGLKGFEARDIRFISGGEKQRAYIARALSGSPEIILMDEPTSSLDVKYQLEVLQLVKTIIHKRNISVIMTIHDLNLASMFCDRIILVKQGKLLKEGTPAEVLNPDDIHFVFGITTFSFERNSTHYINLVNDRNVT